MHKPTILITNRRYPQFAYLEKEYNLLWHPVDSNRSLSEQADEIEVMLSKKKITLDGVLGLFTDAPPIVAAMLAQKFNLISPSVESMYHTQNKAVFAEIMKKNDLPLPTTRAFKIPHSEPFYLRYPLFIRPIKGSFSAGSFIIHTRADLEKNLAYLRTSHIPIVQPCFESFFTAHDKKYQSLDSWYIAQHFIRARQYTLDAFVYKKKVHIIGVTQTIYTNNRRSFKRFDYPGDFPSNKHAMLQKIAQKMVHATQYDNGAFSMEFFLTRANKISIIEMNTRLTYQFIPLYEQRYAISPFEMALSLCLGKMPNIEKKENKNRASSFPLRVWKDMIVKKVPTAAELKELTTTYDALGITIDVAINKKLSDYRQDAYSYRYGVIDIAGETDSIIQKKFANLIQKLPVEFAE